MGLLNLRKSLVVCLVLLQLSINWAEAARPRSADVSRASRSSSTRFDNPRRVRNDLGQIQDPVPTESTPLFSSSVDDVQGADQSFPIQDQISSFITAPSSDDEIDSPVTASSFNPEAADPVPEPFIGVEPAEESSDPVADEPIFGVAPQQSFAGIEGIPVAAPEQVESTQQELEDPSVDFRIVSQQPFPTILVNPPPPPQQVQDPADVVVSEIVAEPLPLEPVVIQQSQSSTEAPLNQPSPPVDAPIPVKLELNPPSGYQSLTHQTEKPSLYKVLPPFFGILYPIPAPHSSYSVGPQVPYDQPKNYPAPTYGPPRLTHPTTQQHHENYPRRQFGFPPTPRALGFPPISNTRDNLHREVNWGRLGRPYRSA